MASFTNIQTQQQVLNYCWYVLSSPVFILVLSICSICSISQDVNESWRANRSPASPLRHRRSGWPLVPGRVKDLEVQWANRIVEYTVQSKSKTAKPISQVLLSWAVLSHSEYKLSTSFNQTLISHIPVQCYTKPHETTMSFTSVPLPPCSVGTHHQNHQPRRAS